MTFPVLSLLLSLLLAARGTPALPRQGVSSSKPSVPADEVMWAAACSPRLALLHLHQDAMLACEMYAPNGTSLVWYKDAKQILPQTEASQHTQPPLPKVTTPRKPRQKNDPFLHISSGLYIDCASSKHQGRYSLQVTTPSRQVYTRNFTVILADDRVSPAMTCYLGRRRVEQIPRIWQYAHSTKGKRGASVLMPCRVVEQDVDTITYWYFRGKRLVPGLNSYKYKVQPSGDLLVMKTEPQDAGLYTCTVHNTHLHYLFDRVHTWLIIPNTRRVSP